MKYWTRTHPGLVRPRNEDAVLALETGLFAVADGMGGHRAGDVASRIAIDTLANALGGEAPDPQILREAVWRANDLIFGYAQEHVECSGMGTTVSVLWTGAESAVLGQVGDSRIYRLREGSFTRLTEDHSVVEEWVRQGLITEQEARIHPYRNVITRALGIGERVEVDVHVVDVRAGDLYLLCSDGLTGMLLDEEIHEILTRETGSGAADALLQRALDAGAHDNVSFILVRAESGVGA